MLPKIDYSPMGTEDVRLRKDSWCSRKHFLEIGSPLTLLHFSLEQAEPTTACCLLSVNTKRNLKPSIFLINTTQCDSFPSHFPFSFPIQNFIFLRVSFQFGCEWVVGQVGKTKLMLYICRIVDFLGSVDVPSYTEVKCGERTFSE